MHGRSVGVRPWTVAEATLRFDNQDAYPKLAHIALPAPRHYVSSRALCLRTYGCQTINGGKTRQKPLHPHFTLVCIWAMVGSSEWELERFAGVSMTQPSVCISGILFSSDAELQFTLN